LSLTLMSSSRASTPCSNRPLSFCSSGPSRWYEISMRRVWLYETTRRSKRVVTISRGCKSPTFPSLTTTSCAAYAKVSEDRCDSILDIVNTPVECVNIECGQLYCTWCLTNQFNINNFSACEVCKNPSCEFRQPSPLVCKLLFSYVISCATCNKGF
jgi:hypothetical protein